MGSGGDRPRRRRALQPPGRRKRIRGRLRGGPNTQPLTIDDSAVAGYLRQTVRAWLGLPADDDVPDLPPELARRLLRVEEYEHEHRDQWGNWEFAFCESFREGRLWEPDVDHWVAARRDELGPRARGLWPGKHPFAVCLTHDVDLIADAVTPRQAARSMRASLRSGAADRSDSLLRLARPGVRAARALYHGIATAPVAEALELCADLERERGVTASYFFTVYPKAEGHRYDCVYDLDDRCTFRGERVRVSDVARRLRDEGFDVGLHGSYNSAANPGVLEREKEALERAVGASVTTTRQHFVHWDVRATPRLQEAAGLAADSTLGFNRNIGARAGTSLPFRWFDLAEGRPLNLVQVPLLVQDGALFRADALELDLELAQAVLGEAIDRAALVGGLVTLVFHPNNLADARYLELFRRTLDHAIGRGAWFASLRDIDALWRERERE